jgi:hypothetical protein
MPMPSTPAVIVVAANSAGAIVKLFKFNLQ